MSNDLNNAIQRISEVYRQMTKEISNINKKVDNITIELQDKGITHIRFVELQKEKESLEKRSIEMTCVANGIAQAREIVFNLM